MDDSDERRRQPRYPVHVKIRYRLAVEEAYGEWCDALVLTAGFGGVFIKSGFDIFIGQEMELDLPFRHGNEMVRGVVRWIASGKVCGFGVQFIDSSDVFNDLITDAVVSGYWLSSQKASERDKSKSDFIIADINDLLENL